MCSSIAKKHLQLFESHQFEVTLADFEKEWSKWDHEHILVWFKTILTKQSINGSKSNTDIEDEKNEPLNDDINGQVAATPGDGNVIGDDDKNMINVKNNDNVDWSSISSNLKTIDEIRI